MSVYRTGAPAPKVAPPAPWWRLLRAWADGTLKRVQYRQRIRKIRADERWALDGINEFRRMAAAYRDGNTNKIFKVPPIGPGKPISR